jgi:hypothetical protein
VTSVELNEPFVATRKMPEFLLHLLFSKGYSAEYERKEYTE